MPLSQTQARPTDTRRILFVTTGLERGGAEQMLLKLLSEHAKRPASSHDPLLAGWLPEVLSLRSGGPLAEPIAQLGVKVHELRSRPRDLVGNIKLLWHLRQQGFDVVQGWMYHGNLLASLLCFGTGVPVFWSVRQSFSRWRHEKLHTALAIWMGARLSRTVRGVIFNSRLAARQHEALGFHSQRTVHIPNGFDTQRFRPDDESRSARSELRKRLGLNSQNGAHEPSELFVVMLARYHPMKDFPSFFRAASLLKKRFASSQETQGQRLHFLLAGQGVRADNSALLQDIMQCGPGLILGEDLHLLGALSSVEQLLAGSDLLVLASSHGDAFPNVLGEAMACGTFCVATDVGDVGDILGNGLGSVVPPRDPEALAAACHAYLSRNGSERQRLSSDARRSVKARYDMPQITQVYFDTYAKACSERANYFGSLQRGGNGP